jgi:chromosome segregation ATPase
MNETAPAPLPQCGAHIVAFPADRARPPSPQSRLTRALQALRDALAEQREAAHALQHASARLKATLADLQTRLEGQRDGLGHLAGTVAQVTVEARKLESWADGVIARETGKG